jgi:transposase InsO family protein
MRYQFIQEHAGPYPVTLLCQVLQVARSGYYAWCRRPESRRAQEDRRLLAKITAIHTTSRQTYGSPRVLIALQQQGETCGRHRVARVMRMHDLVGKQRRRSRVTTTDSRHALPVAANVLDRQFRPVAPNQAWVSDITYIATGEGWVYLATVMDLYSRRIVGWAMSERIDRVLVRDALTAALRDRHPAAGLVHHSDRGSQYASADYQALLAQHGLIPSMSRRGNCWDNACMESFFHSLKVEWLSDQTFRTRAEARQAVFTYIEVWYNRQRLHSTLGYRSPEQYEQLLAA